MFVIIVNTERVIDYPVHTSITQTKSMFSIHFPHSTISSILGAWLDQYSEDFRQAPDYFCLKQLIAYVRHNIPGSDLERRARNLLTQFQRQEISELDQDGK